MKILSFLVWVKILVRGGWGYIYRGFLRDVCISIYIYSSHLLARYIETCAAEVPEPQTPQCVLAIAMIDSLGSGFALPEQPDGPFENIDVSSPRKVMAATATLLYECLQRGKQRGSDRWDAALGWSQIGI